MPEIHISSIPKRNQPGKWRLIVDLSNPEGHSVNNGIDAGVCSLSYVTMQDAVLSGLRWMSKRRTGRFLSIRAIVTCWAGPRVHRHHPPIRPAQHNNYILGGGRCSRVGCQAAGSRPHISLDRRLRSSRPAPVRRFPRRPAVTPGFMQHSRYMPIAHKKTEGPSICLTV